MVSDILDRRGARIVVRTLEARESRRRSWCCPNWEFSIIAKVEGLFHDDQGRDVLLMHTR
jgi:hypothetical protein